MEERNLPSFRDLVVIKLYSRQFTKYVLLLYTAVQDQPYLFYCRHLFDGRQTSYGRYFPRSLPFRSCFKNGAGQGIPAQQPRPSNRDVPLVRGCCQLGKPPPIIPTGAGGIEDPPATILRRSDGWGNAAEDEQCGFVQSLGNIDLHIFLITVFPSQSFIQPTESHHRKVPFPEHRNNHDLQAIGDR